MKKLILLISLLVAGCVHLPDTAGPPASPPGAAVAVHESTYGHITGTPLDVADIDDTPADDADAPPSSKWVYDNIGTSIAADVKELLSSADYDAARTYLNVESGADVTDSTNVTTAGARMDSEYTSAALTIDDNPEQITVSSSVWVDERNVSGDADGYEIELLESSNVDGQEVVITNIDTADTYHVDDANANVENPNDKTVYIAPGMSAKWRYNNLAWHHVSGGSYDLVASSIETAYMAHFASADFPYADNAGGTPYALTHSEVSGRILTSYGIAEDSVYTFPAATGGENGLFQIGAAYQVDLEPPSGAAFWLNGTEMAADEHIVNAGDTEGEIIGWYVVEVSDGVYEYHFESKYANWAEATPS